MRQVWCGGQSKGRVLERMKEGKLSAERAQPLVVFLKALKVTEVLDRGKDGLDFGQE